MVHELPSLQLLGHQPCGSQVSPASTTPLPQLAEQLLSLLALQPGGQQPSPLRQVVIGCRVQAAVQLAALPLSESSVHALPSLHVAATSRQTATGSQVSPASIVPLLQVTLQSRSLLLLQPGGQHPSPLEHWVMVW